MKIGIYDKWLTSLGGGEKVATLMAEVLADAGHDVDLISNFEIDKREVEEKMSVNLSKIKLVVWYERSYFALSPKTKKYDLFINVSFMDHLPSMAKKSIYYVHFPTPLKTTILGFIKYEKLLPFLRKFLIIPEVQSGITPVDDIYTRSGRWLEGENTVVFSNTPKSFKLTLRFYVEQLSLSSLDSITFKSPNSKIRVLDRYVDHYYNVGVFKLEIKAPENNMALKIIIDEDTKNNGFGLVSMAVKDIRFLFWNFFKRYMPRHEMALYGSTSFKLAEGLDTYDYFLANSEYTRTWIKKYWNKNSDVLYPPVDVEKFVSGKKKNIILNVGRFFIGGHSKKQDVLLEAFKQMFEKGLIDRSWELHFVGGVAGGKEHEDYLNMIKAKSEGYNVHFHISLPFSDLKKLYSEAAIYWHATGFGEDKNNNPISFEHFGITVVEAMSAGAVPVVFDGGGLTETVDNKSGFTWNTVNELVQKTYLLIRNKRLLTNYSNSAIIKSKHFSKNNFRSKIVDYVKK